jgi:hypothetical protein
MCTYIAIYRGKQIEINAETLLEAHNLAVKQFKARKSWDVSIYLCEVDGKQIVHDPAILGS